MKKLFRSLALRAAILLGLAAPAFGAAGTIFIDTGGCNSGSTTQCSGTTDSASATISGTAATWTSGVNSITLDTNTNISGVSGCSAGTCNGSQALFLTNATNANRKIFWLASYTGCTGSGACTVVVDVAPTCTTCTAQNWGVGGRMIYNTQNFEGAPRPLDTIILNNTPASKTTVFITLRNSGDNTGKIFLQGKVGVRPILQTTNNSVVISCTSQTNWAIKNLEIQSQVTAGTPAVFFNGCQNMLVDNLMFSTANGGDFINMNGISTAIYNSEFKATGGSGAGIIVSSAPSSIYGNYFHGVGGDCIQNNSATATLTIESNVLSGCGGAAINLAGAPTAQFYLAVIRGNTIYNPVGNGLTVGDADYTVRLYNNIFVRNDNTASFNVAWTAGNADFGSSHGCNVFYQAGAGGNVSNLTTNSTEFTTNPLLNAPGSGDFTLSSSSSPAANAGCYNSLLGITGTNFLDIGAMQRSHGGGGGIPPIIGQ